MGISACNTGHYKDIGITTLACKKKIFGLFNEEENTFNIQVPKLVVLGLSDVKLVTKVGRAGLVRYKDIDSSIFVAYLF